MKKLFFLLACVAMSVLSMAQVNQLVWANGHLLYGTPIESIDSLTYDEMEDIDTLHLLLPRTLIKVVHDTVYIHDTVYVETDCGEDTPSSAGIGAFSVSADKQVTFSQGNLQYHPANNKWRFAENQTDYIGDANSNCSSTYIGWLDLFGWSTSSTNFGVSTSTDYNDYLGSFVDWGTNKIGNDAPNTWRTLTDDEWYYLRYTRTNADALCGVAQVNGVNGLILLPDNWTCPAGVTFKSGFHNNYGVEYYAAYQTFTAAEWSKLEAAGAVFLPASGNRGGSNVNLVQNFGRYWSATENGSYNARSLYLDSFEAGLNFYDRYDGHSVRLVKDIEGGGATPDTPTEPEEPTNPSAGIGVFSVFGKEVTFSKGNLQYHPANDEWRFAENQSDCIGNANSNIAADYDGWIDLFGWGTGDAPTKSSTSNSDYSTFVDWGTNQIGSDAPNTWRTLTYDEWYSLLYTRTNANDLCGVAQVNGVNGLILLPDNWTCPSGVSFKSGFHSEWGVEYYADYQTFTAAEWSKLEAAGAVFLPAAGYRDGYYWSATGWYENISSFDVFGAYCLTFGSGGADVNLDDRYSGLSVRLVKDLQ